MTERINRPAPRIEIVAYRGAHTAPIGAVAVNAEAGDPPISLFNVGVAIDGAMYAQVIRENFEALLAARPNDHELRERVRGYFAAARKRFAELHRDGIVSALQDPEGLLPPDPTSAEIVGEGF